MSPENDAQRIMEYLTAMKSQLDIHIATSRIQDAKVDTMYEALITGNGKPSLKSRVAALEDKVIDKDTITEFKNELDKINEKVPSKDDWGEVRQWASWSKWIAGIIVASTIAQAVALYFKILTQ